MMKGEGKQIFTCVPLYMTRIIGAYCAILWGLGRHKMRKIRHSSSLTMGTLFKPFFIGHDWPF